MWYLMRNANIYMDEFPCSYFLYIKYFKNDLFVYSNTRSTGNINQLYKKA